MLIIAPLKKDISEHKCSSKLLPQKNTFQNISSLQNCLLKKYISKTFIIIHNLKFMYFIIYIFYNNLGICAVIIYFYCMLKARKKTDNLSYIA